MRILIAPTHVGQALKSGDIAELKRRHKPAAVLLTEVQNPDVRAAARRVFPRLGWIAGGLVPASTGTGSAGTLVFAKRSVFAKVDQGNELVSPFLDRWHPTRRTTWLRLRVRALSKARRWVVTLVPAHTWTQANTQGPTHRTMVLDGFRRQVDAYAHVARDHIAEGGEVIAAGDWNASVGDGGTYVEACMRSAGLTTARPGGITEHAALRLVEAYLSPGLEVVSYTIEPPAADRGRDHIALVVDVRRRSSASA